MLKIILLTGFLLISLGICQKKKDQILHFDTKYYSELQETAEWLGRYDAMAWITSDSVMTKPKEDLVKLDKEWFCMQENDTIWHAFYGRFNGNQYEIQYHYVYNRSNGLKEVFTMPTESERINAYARAIKLGYRDVQPIVDTMGIRFNHYIRTNEDGTLQLWIFPAFQPDGAAIYGWEYVYKLDSRGEKILENQSYMLPNLRGLKVDEEKELWLNYEVLEKPTIGGIFFVYYYRKYFKRIFLQTKYYITSIINSGDGEWQWISVEVQDKKSKK